MRDKESFGAELAKQLPIKEIYNDLAQPALSTVGKTLGDVTKVALSPISALVWGYDKIASYLEISIIEYFEKRKIPKEQITTPDPAIAVPLIEAMRYSASKEELRSMFVNLLGASMDSNIIDAHPAFVEIIKQLSPDECRMLKYLKIDNRMPMLKKRIVLENGGEVDITPYFSDICYRAKCNLPSKFPEYLDNLRRLGLVDIYYDRYITGDEYYELLLQHSGFPIPAKYSETVTVEKRSMYELSAFGKTFCKICISEE